MADYIKATNFATKDTLSTGDPAKIVRGTEIDAEFSAIESAIESKADINNPAFTGTPTAPTPSTGTENTQIATTAYVANKLSALPSGGVTSFSAGSTGFTPSSASTGSVVLSGTLNAGNGGTGLASYTAGDLVYATGSTTLAKRSIGTTGQVLTVVSGVPAWATPETGGGGGTLLQRVVRRNTGSFSTTSTSYQEVTGWSGALSITVSAGSYVKITAYAAAFLVSDNGGTPFSAAGGLIAIRSGTSVLSRGIFENSVESDGIELSTIPSINHVQGPLNAGTAVYNLAIVKTINAAQVQIEGDMWFVMEEYTV